jgi:DNA-binding MarR family transcriptional regulator
MPFVPGPPAVPGLLLHHSALLWRTTLADALAPLDLTPAQFFLLASLWWLGRKLGRMPTQRELADHAALDRMMTSQLTRALAARGLVLRHHDAADRRAFRIALALQRKSSGDRL